MAFRRQSTRVVDESPRAEQCHKGAQLDLFSSANINMLEQFVVFCKSKHMNEHNGAPQRVNGVGNDRVESIGFKDKLNMYFGEFLPTNVIDELCKLVHENSYGKCSFCMLPTESLVLSVLQILLDATQSSDEPKESNNVAPVFVHKNRVNDNVLREQSNRHVMKPVGDEKVVHTTIFRSQNSVPSTGPFGVSDGKSMMNPHLVLDTPVIQNQGYHEVDEFASVPGNVPNLKKKARIEGPKPPPDVEVLGVSSLKDRCTQLGKLSDDLYNKRNFISVAVPPTIDLTGGIPDARRFVVTDEERAYYKIICGLAYSQWSCLKAVEFSRTSVTYLSLGQSVEPRGKFFEDQHPRQSKKHYFYTKVGGCPFTYNCSYDIDTVKNCFLGANSAHKLYLSDKLCFPIVVHKHWFVFIVDLKNKQYVFLDSYFSGDHNFQKEARTKLIDAFKESWYLYAERGVDVDQFSVLYPPVPKQTNIVDCGVYALKFMELWDNNVDLRDMFDDSDIPNICVKLGVDLFFSKGNCVDKSLVMNLYKQGVDPRVCN